MKKFLFFLVLVACVSKKIKDDNFQAVVHTSKNISSSDYSEKNRIIQIFKNEPYPANTLPIEILHEDQNTFLKSEPLPDIVKTHSYEGEEYGLRMFESEKALFKTIKSGDILVKFQALSPVSHPISIIRDGLLHSAIVVDGEAFYDIEHQKNPTVSKTPYCHIDSDPGYSNCKFDEPSHYFRMVNMTEDEIADAAHDALQLYQTNAYDYNYAFKLNLGSNSCPDMEQKIFKAKAAPDIHKLVFYCSEFVYTLFSVRKKEKIFPETSFSQIVNDFGNKIKKNHFVFAKSPDDIHKLLVEDIDSAHKGKAQNLGFSTLFKILAKTFYDGYSSSLLKMGFDYHTGGMVTPSDFMTDAKKKTHKALVYLGSYMPPATKKKMSLPLSGDYKLKLKNLDTEAYSPSTLAYNPSHLFFASSTEVTSYAPPSGVSIEQAYILDAESVLLVERENKGKNSNLILEQFNTMDQRPRLIKKYDSHNFFNKSRGEFIATSLERNVGIKSAQQEVCVGISMKHQGKKSVHYSSIETVCIQYFPFAMVRSIRGLSLSEVSENKQYGLYITGTSKAPTVFTITDLISKKDLFILTDKRGSRYEILGFRGNSEGVYYIDKVTKQIMEVSLKKESPEEREYLKISDKIDLKKSRFLNFSNSLHTIARVVDSKNACKECSVEILVTETGERLMTIDWKSKIINLAASDDGSHLVFEDETGGVYQHALYY